MKLYLFFILILTLFSCSNNDLTILIDQYYASINSLESLESIVVLETFSPESYFDRDSIILSPLLFKYYKDKWSDFPGEIRILEGNFIETDRVKNLEVDYRMAVNELVQILKSDSENIENNKISVVSDFLTDIDRESVGILKGLEEFYSIEYMLVTDTVSKGAVKKFISDNEDSQIWLIFSKTMGLYSYQNIKSGEICLYAPDLLYKNNYSIRWGIVPEILNNLDNIVSERIDKIPSVLKKY